MNLQATERLQKIEKNS